MIGQYDDDGVQVCPPWARTRLLSDMKRAYIEALRGQASLRGDQAMDEATAAAERALDALFPDPTLAEIEHELAETQRYSAEHPDHFTWDDAREEHGYVLCDQVSDLKDIAERMKKT